MKFRIIIFHVYRVKSIIIDPCIINNRKKIKKRMTISSEMFHDRCTSIRSFCKVGRCIVLQKKKKRRRTEKLERFRSMDRWSPIEANLEHPAPLVFAAPIAFEHVRLLTESVGPPCQRACTGSSIISAESVSSFLKQNDDENEVPSNG